MPIRELAAVTQISEETITEAEHGNTPVPAALEDKIASLMSITDKYVDQLITESREQGYILTYRFNGEMSGYLSEFSGLGSMWHRSCAALAHNETGLPIKYIPRKPRIKL
jgi:hypothetical protein